MIDRDLGRVARRHADRQSDRLAAIPFTRQVVLTVAAVTVGGAGGGGDLVKVNWRDALVTVNGYAEGQTFAVGDRVKCSVIDRQLFIDYRIVGQP